MNFRWSLLTLALCGCLWGCATTTPVGGFLYSNVKGPVAATSNPRGPKMGEACATSYLGLIGLGDASITAASKAGGIMQISYVEQNSTNILGLINTYCTIVWGNAGGGMPMGQRPMAAGRPPTTTPAPAQGGAAPAPAPAPAPNDPGF